MSELDAVRAAHPEFKDLSDQDLAYGLYQTHFSDMPMQDYYSQIEIDPNAKTMRGEPINTTGWGGVKEDVISGLKGAFPAAGHMIAEGGRGLYDLAGGNNERDNSLSNHLREMVGIPVKRKNDYPMDRFAKVVGSSLLKGGRGLLNVPGNIVDYGHKKDIIPDWVDAWRPGENIQNFDYDKELGIEGKRAGDVVPASAGMIPALVATGGNLPLAAAIQSIGENQNPIESSLSTFLVKKGAENLPKAVEIAKKAPEIAKAGVDAITPTRYSQTKTLNKAADIVSDTLNDIKADYTKVLTDARLPPTVNVNIDPKLVADFKRGAPGFATNLEKAIESGNLNDIHQAATDLGDYARNVKSRKTKASPKVQQTAIDANAIKAQLEKIIDTTLEKHPGLRETYRAADKKYADYKETVPKTLEETLMDYQKGLLLEKDAVKGFSGKNAAKFRKKYKSELPGIETALHENTLKNVPVIRQGANFVEKYLGNKT